MTPTAAVKHPCWLCAASDRPMVWRRTVSSEQLYAHGSLQSTALCHAGGWGPGRGGVEEAVREKRACDDYGWGSMTIHEHRRA